MVEKRKRSSKLDLNLCPKGPVDQEEPSKKVLSLDEAIELELKNGNVDPNVDLKKLKRTISNRLSAQRVRIRRVDYTAELEKKAKFFEDNIAFFVQEIENNRDKSNMLMLENNLLRERLDYVTDKSKLRTAQIEENKLELRRLKELHEAQKKERNRSEIEGQSFNNYESESAAGTDINQYLNLDAMDFFPFKNE